MRGVKGGSIEGVGAAVSGRCRGRYQGSARLVAGAGFTLGTFGTKKKEAKSFNPSFMNE